MTESWDCPGGATIILNVAHKLKVFIILKPKIIHTYTKDLWCWDHLLWLLVWHDRGDVRPLGIFHIRTLWMKIRRWFLSPMMTIQRMISISIIKSLSLTFTNTYQYTEKDCLDSAPITCCPANLLSTSALHLQPPWSVWVPYVQAHSSDEISLCLVQMSGTLCLPSLRPGDLSRLVFCWSCLILLCLDRASSLTPPHLPTALHS